MTGVQSSLSVNLTQPPSDWLANTPVPIFGAALGLHGIHLLLALNERLAAVPYLLELSFFLGTAVLAISILMHALRWMWRRSVFMADFRNPAVLPFFGQIGIALLLIAESVHLTNLQLSGAAFWVGSIVSLCLTVLWLYRCFSTRFSLAWVGPSWFVLPIAMLYIALLAPYFVAPSLSVIAWGLGAAEALLVAILLLARLLWGPSLPKPARPGLAIALAPPALLLLGLYDSSNGVLSIAAIVLYALTLAGYLMALLGLLVVLRQPFAVSWWAFGMPLTAAAIALDARAKTLMHPLALQLAHASMLSSLVITGGLALLSLYAVVRHIRTHG